MGCVIAIQNEWRLTHWLKRAPGFSIKCVKTHKPLKIFPIKFEAFLTSRIGETQWPL